MRINEIVSNDFDLKSYVSEIYGINIDSETEKKIMDKMSPPDMIALRHYVDSNNAVEAATLINDALRSNGVLETMMQGRGPAITSAAHKSTAVPSSTKQTPVVQNQPVQPNMAQDDSDEVEDDDADTDQ